MYKKIPIIFFFILIVNPTFGQDYPLGIRNIDKQNNNYYLTTNLDWKVEYTTEYCEATFETFVDGQSKISENLGGDEEKKVQYSSFLSYKPSKINFRARAKDAGHTWVLLKGYKNSCNKLTSTADKTSNYKDIIFCKEEKEKIHDFKDKKNLSSGYEVEYWLTIKYKIVPLHTLKTSDNNSARFLPIDVKVPLIAKEGFDNNLYHYEYATEKNPYNWRPLPARFQQKQKKQKR